MKAVTGDTPGLFDRRCGRYAKENSQALPENRSGYFGVQANRPGNFEASADQTSGKPYTYIAVGNETTEKFDIGHW